MLFLVVVAVVIAVAHGVIVFHIVGVVHVVVVVRVVVVRVVVVDMLFISLLLLLSLTHTHALPFQWQSGRQTASGHFRPGLQCPHKCPHPRPLLVGVAPGWSIHEQDPV